MSRWSLVVLAVALLSAGCAGGGDDLRTGAPGPDTPVGTGVSPGEPGDEEPQPERVEPVPGAVEVHARPFEEAVPVGERRVVVRWWGGVAPCHVLAGVDVRSEPHQVTLTLLEGRDGAVPPDTACIEVARWFETVVELDEPLDGRAVIDGAAEPDA